MMAKAKPVKATIVRKKEVPVPSKGGGVFLAVIILLAVAVRMTYLFLSRKSPFFEPLLLDPAYYHQWAERLAAGDFGNEVFYGLPLYPFFLAVFYKLTPFSYVTAKVVQLLIGGIGTVYFVYKIGEKISTRAVGLIAALLAAFYEPFFFYEAMVIPEALAIPLYAAAFYSVLCFSDKPTAKKALGLGILLGLCTLAKAGVMIFVLALPFLIVLRKKDSGRPWAPALLVLATFILTLAPVAAYNYAKGSGGLMLTSHSGFNFYAGNHEGAEGTFAAPEGTGTNVTSQKEDSKNLAEEAMGRPLNMTEVSKYWSEKAWQFIRENPEYFARLSLKKILLFFNGTEITDVNDLVFERRFNTILKLPWVRFPFVGTLFLVGILFSSALRYKRFLFVWIGGYLVGLIFFFVNSRYRLPVMTVFFPVAAYALFHIVETIRRGFVLKSGLMALTLFVSIFIIAQNPLTHAESAEFVKAGDAMMEKKDYQRALVFYKEALSLDVQSWKVHQALGVAFTKLQDDASGRSEFEKAIELNPQAWMPLNNLGNLADRQGNLADAEKYFLKAVELKPTSSVARNNLGMVYGKQGLNDKAFEELTKALQLNPNNAQAHLNLGLIQYRQGKLKEARASWKRALEIRPDLEKARQALKTLGA